MRMLFRRRVLLCKNLIIVGKLAVIKLGFFSF